MKKIFTSLLLGAMATTVFGQWDKTTLQGERIRPNTDVKQYYTLDLNAVRAKLNNAQESGKGAVPVALEIPTLNGKIEKFAVYSRPVVVKSLQEKYGLGSYVGVGIDDPEKYVRFSVSPYDFQSMIIKNGVYEFVEPQNKEKTVYGVHPKTNKTNAADGSSWLCTSTEPVPTKAQIDKMISSGNNFANNPTDFSKASDRKYRTMRLAMSVNGEYTQYFGGVSQALSAINATITRCNGVFEKDFALHLILQDFPQLIYTNPSTDPYTTMGNWNTQLMNTLHNTIGDDAFDIGHMFGASGGGGNAGCIGCVCSNTLATGVSSNSATANYKGSGITSPADGIPQGDNFDIDYVAHEIGHQLGADHTFSHGIQSAPFNTAHAEPGSGSTIMGYAGITGSTDVQPHSDAYFHIKSIVQVQTNLISKTCDIETSIANEPPVITAMPDLTIPKSTPFVLTAQATDPEGDPITYTWEQTDVATSTTSTSNLGNLTNGPTFRSWTPTTDPARYFPKFSTVLAGNIKNTADWEAVPTVARTLNFTVTVRDNNADVTQQQTASATQKVTVGANGPFKLTTAKVYNNAAGPLTWDVAGTNAAPYNVANVKIDYSTNGGNTWTVLVTSTPNDGTEDFSFSSFPTETNMIVRVSAIGNVFYTLGNVIVSQIVLCDGSSPVGLAVTDITPNSAKISWDPISGASYILRYRKAGDATWIEVPTSTNSVTLNGILEESTQYEYQVASVCSGTTGTYSSIRQFTTSMLAYCTLTSTNSTFEYISNVTVTPQGGTVMSNNSGASNYTDYTGDSSKLITLYKGTTTNTISVSKAWQGTKYNESIKVWIDFDRSGTFETGELVLQTPLNQTTPVSATFSVPATAYSGNKPLRMRVSLRDAVQTNPCGSYQYGEVEDYAVLIPGTLAVSDAAKNSSEVQVYPNPATDVLNVSRVSSKSTYAIYTVSGQLVSKGTITDGKVRVSHLEKGVYIINVEDNGTSSKTKFIKK